MILDYFIELLSSSLFIDLFTFTSTSIYSSVHKEPNLGDSHENWIVFKSFVNQIVLSVETWFRQPCYISIHHSILVLGSLRGNQCPALSSGTKVSLLPHVCIVNYLLHPLLHFNSGDRIISRLQRWNILKTTMNIRHF